MKKYIKLAAFVMCILFLFGCSPVQNNEQQSDTTDVVYNTNPVQSPIYYAKLACDEFMGNYSYRNLPPAGVLFYHQGVLLSGMQRVYVQTGNEKYFNFIKNYVDGVTGPNGEIIGFDHELVNASTPQLPRQALTMLDHKQPVILMYNLYDVTQNEKYLNSIKTISESMYYWPVNNSGGYWHKLTEPNQMWLDSAYMAGPLSVMYSQLTGDNRLRDRAIQQIFIMDDNMKDKKSGLYYHGWDESKQQPWADKNTGLSSQIWGRAVGWYAVAITDMLDYIPEIHPDVPRLKQILSDLLTNLAQYQDKDTGMWYQITDKPGATGNWLESSSTNLFIYSYAKAIRKGIISKEQFGELTEKAYKGSLASTYVDENGDFVIDKVCVGTNIDSGTYEHYINREQIKNDLHGGGAFILMCTEMENYYNMEEN